MPYTLQHTAEAIDYKLNLIDKNKNLLPYPYPTTFPAGLEDVGDGSILTTAVVGATEKEIYLNTCVLPAGNYAVSVDTTDIIDTTKPVTNPGFSLILKTADEANIDVSDGSFELTTSTSVKVYLRVPNVFSADLVVKPQIEEGTEKTAWVPYMDKIGNYVDERFNGTNTKIKVVADSIVAHAANTNNPHAITLEQLGLKTETLIFELDNGETLSRSMVVVNG